MTPCGFLRDCRFPSSAAVIITGEWREGCAVARKARRREPAGPEYRLGAYFPSTYPRIDSCLRSLEAHTQTITAPPPQALPVTESVALPPIRGKHHAPISTPVVRHSISCNWAPRLSEVQGPYDARQHRASTRPGRR